MKNDLLDRIRYAMPKFSKGQRAIGGYILSNYDKAAFMTASKLGDVTGVSESTVVRFATALGFEGYPELQIALQELIRIRLTSVQRMEVTNDRIGEGDVLETVLNSDMAKIRATLESVNRTVFNAATEAILGARRIYIIGMRSSASLASFLAFNFRFMFDNVTLVQTTSGSEIFEQLLR
ncbi:MAG: MurR/RpiR family transcriptional regulator, partial [Ruminococcaceae bacterium]|nr:MurR/RpiR family transcriptional regulator [Oscillospiraceae bacterium]